MSKHEDDEVTVSYVVTLSFDRKAFQQFLINDLESAIEAGVPGCGVAGIIEKKESV